MIYVGMCGKSICLKMMVIVAVSVTTRVSTVSSVPRWWLVRLHLRQMFFAIKVEALVLRASPVELNHEL